MLRPMPIEPVPPETARVARAACPQGHRSLRLADELDTLFTDALCTPLFPASGQPALAPWRLALVTVWFWRGGLPQAHAHVEAGLAAYDAHRDRVHAHFLWA